MRKRKNIFLKIFLLIVLLFIPVFSAHSNSDTGRYLTEISRDTDNTEIRLTPDNDLSDEDQIGQSDNSDLSEQHECQQYGFKTLPLLNILIVYIWQPPKIYYTKI